MKPRSFSKITITISALFIFCGLFTATSGAAPFTVTNTGDNLGVNPPPGAGTGTLRQAIVDANANAGADTITFSPIVTGTILLASALPNLSDDVTINGPGANTLAVNGNAATRIFQIGAGADVTIDGLTVMNGHVVGPSFGGGIFNAGTLTVTNSTISGNSATAGGGIVNDGEFGSATLTITNSTISGNSATGAGNVDGGGILNDGVLGSATLTITTAPSAATRPLPPAAASSTTVRSAARR
jgi:hypothetical protein